MLRRSVGVLFGTESEAKIAKAARSVALRTNLILICLEFAFSSHLADKPFKQSEDDGRRERSKAHEGDDDGREAVRCDLCCWRGNVKHLY